METNKREKMLNVCRLVEQLGQLKKKKGDSISIIFDKHLRKKTGKETFRLANKALCKLQRSAIEFIGNHKVRVTTHNLYYLSNCSLFTFHVVYE